MNLDKLLDCVRPEIFPPIEKVIPLYFNGVWTCHGNDKRDVVQNAFCGNMNDVMLVFLQVIPPRSMEVKMKACATAGGVFQRRIYGVKVPLMSGFYNNRTRCTSKFVEGVSSAKGGDGAEIEFDGFDTAVFFNYGPNDCVLLCVDLKVDVERVGGGNAKYQINFLPSTLETWKQIVGFSVCGLKNLTNEVSLSGKSM